MSTETLVIVVIVLAFVAGFALGLGLGTHFENRLLRRLQFGSSDPIRQQPRSLLTEEQEVASAISPPAEIVRPEEIDRGTQKLLALAQQEGREMSREEARRQATIMLMQERGLIED